MTRQKSCQAQVPDLRGPCLALPVSYLESCSFNQMRHSQLAAYQTPPSACLHACFPQSVQEGFEWMVEALRTLRHIWAM
jgi:hypothetical protein